MRKEGWERLLYEHIRDAGETQFAWGIHDCALWSAEWVQKATGVDHGADWRGKYSSEEGLQALMMERGYHSPAAIADENLRSAPLAFAQRGDIVQHPVHDSLGICDGLYSYFIMKEGITRVPTHSCVAAWKVS